MYLYSFLNLKEYKNHWKTLCLWGGLFVEARIIRFHKYRWWLTEKLRY